MAESGRNAYPGTGTSYPQKAMLSRGSGSRDENSPWAELISQFQTMINENEKLQHALRRNTEEIENKTREFQRTLREKDEELKLANKKYWDVRVSVIGFKARIMKLEGELGETTEMSLKLKGELEELKTRYLKATSGDSFSQASQQGMEQLQRELEKVKRDKEMVEFERQQTRTEMGQLHGSLEAKVRRLSDQVRDLQSQLQKKSGECTTLHSQVREVSIRCETTLKENQKLERLLAEQAKRPTPKPRTGLVQREAELQRQVEQLREQWLATRQQLQEAEGRQKFAQASTAASHEMESHIRDLQRELDKAKNETLRERKARDGAEQRLTDTLKKREDLEQKNRELHRTIDSKNKELTQLQMRSADVAHGGKNDPASKKLVEARKKNIQLTSERDDLIAKNSELRNRLSQLELAVEDVQSREQETAQQLKEKLDDAHRQLEDLQAEKSDLHQKLSEKLAALDSIEEKNYTMGQENSQLQSAIQFAQDELQNCREKLHSSEVEQSRLQSRLMKQHQIKQKEEKDWESFITEQTQGVQRMKEESEKLRLENNRLKQEVKRLENDKERLGQKLEAKMKECLDSIENSKMWKVQVDVVTSDYREERQAREKMVREMNLLQQANQRKDQDLTSLKDQVTKQRSQIAVLKELVDQDTIHDTSDFSEPNRLGSVMEGGAPQRPMEGMWPSPAGGNLPAVVDPVMSGATPQRPTERAAWPSSSQGFGDNQFTSPDMPQGRPRMYDTTPNPKPPVMSTGLDYSAGVGDFGRTPVVAPMGAVPGRVGGAYTEYQRPATNIPESYQQQHMEAFDTRVPMPGEVENPNRPVMACPICGRNDFQTQTELEVHSAKCIHFGLS